FYVVDRGTLRVHGGGREIARLGPGDCFGEISLLRGMPRMATVTAAEPVVLYALDRDDFLAILVGQPRVAQQARRFAAARLGETLTPRAP
ncbi:MAG TPA: cyclic nucleotide-binding domain-containing protein, partial [Solirubrobacteraceae bacterium]|nr:cyclic nucleotide-binding domain-containing protein [Solirubrobacteraceae bacterium]